MNVVPFLYYCLSPAYMKKYTVPRFAGHSLGPVRQRASFTREGFPASRVIPWVRSGSGPASPGRVFPEPEGPVPAIGDRDEQFASGWRRTRKHDNWPPRL
ncbi:hypothetical protein DY000_02038421 [Brassica cretica]|uniref:Uncharacterized protein n=1 Tax=Brassica cretica TaxID=69181 RepID=A0ABQ7B935_BRACR|nr:hypothetical protein DY000_02038421 [Brassica cretica]